MNTHSFRNRLKKYMADKKINQIGLSAQTGVPQAAISRFLSGRDVRSGHILALLSYLPPDLMPWASSPGEGDEDE